MENILQNKSAMVWAFDEVIDKNTSFEGNTNDKSIKEIGDIIDFLIMIDITHMPDYGITKKILVDFKDVITKTQSDMTILEASSLEASSLEASSLEASNEYFLVGWTGHAIFIFWELQLNGLYNVGIINCGQGIELQGFNNDICNGILIFKNIEKERVNNFITYYKYFYHNSRKIDPSFTENKRYYSFYFMLIDKLLNIPNSVDINTLIKRGLIESYQINSQIIGSCGFTNYINYIYYIYCKSMQKPCDFKLLYSNYLQWYNKCKEILKNIIFDEIILKNDTSNYNIYKYVLTTNNREPNAIYEENIKNLPIKQKSQKKYLPISNNDSMLSRNAIDTLFKKTFPDEIIQFISKEAYREERVEFELFITFLETGNDLLDSLWDIYDKEDNTKLRHILKIYNKFEQIIFISLFVFYKICNYFDNKMHCIIPLLILYDLKKTGYSFTIKNTTSILKYLHTHERVTTYHRTERTIDIFYNSVIYLLLIFNKELANPIDFYYNNDAVKKTANINFYSFMLSEMPIINRKYRAIIQVFIDDLNNNIELLPDYTVKSERLIHYSFVKNYSIVINAYPIYQSNIFFHIFLSNISPPFTAYSFKSFTINNKINNFLLQNILVDTTVFDTNNKGTDIFEKLGYNKNDYNKNDYNKSIDDVSRQSPLLIDLISLSLTAEGLSKDNFIVDTSDITSIYGYPGEYDVVLHKINLFYAKIEKILIDINSDEITNDILMYYIVYFYLCEIRCEKIRLDIFAKYDSEVSSYFMDLYSSAKYKPFVYTYALKYNKDYNFKNKIIEINDYCIIPLNERDKFKQHIYNYIGVDNYMKSVIDFYIIPLVSLDSHDEYKIVIYKDENNTEDSIDIIKHFLLNNYTSIYISLNFYFKKNPDEIIGFHKTNINNNLYYLEKDDELFYSINGIRYIVLKNETELPSEKFKNFYYTMYHNDDSILLYKDNLINEFFMILGNYDLIFRMKDDIIYYKEYIVHFCDDPDIYENYGIIKLVKDNIIKLLSFYNYQTIIENKYNRHGEKHFIEKYDMEEYMLPYKGFIDIDTIYKKYNYSIINFYENNYILTDIYDALSIMLNCFNYNSPYLLLKTIAQIKILINNFDKPLSKLIHTLMRRFNNIYSLPIIILLNEQKKLNKYNYDYFNKYLLGNNIPLKCTLLYKYRDDEYGIRNILGEYDVLSYTLLSLEIIKSMEKYFYYTDDTLEHNYTTNIPSSKIVYDYFTYLIVGNENRAIPVGKFTININMYNSNIVHSFVDIKYSDNHISKNKNDFEKLLKIFIPIFDIESFNKNIIKSEELYLYLIEPNKQYLYPIQEMIMGSGKSSTITPFICLLLLNKFLSEHKYSNEIYIVMPDFLIKQSFQTLMKNLFPLFNNTEILINGKHPMYENSVKIYLTSDTDYKIKFLSRRIETEVLYMIYDEVDMMSNPLTCELNIPSDEKELENIDMLYDIAKKLYERMFTNDIFWSKISDKIDNKIHNYIYSLDIYKEYIIDYYDNVISDDKGSYTRNMMNLFSYIKENILFFIFTKQFNFDYGMPSEYNTTNFKYKFKAIPYSGIDNPIMGSEFSDPILTYILTYFSYRLMNQRFRSIDKQYIVELFETNYNSKKNKDTETLLFNLFISKPKNIIEFKNNREHYINCLKDVFDIDKQYLDEIIKNILDINKTYYSQCENISFNDMMLYKNVKNFVCFTGTAYINTIKGLDISFPENDIVYGKIENPKDHTQFDTVEIAIEHIINNPTITTNIYINQTNEQLIDDIFNCLHLYDVLIDIGGVFIKYNIELFIQEYEKNLGSKEYIVYFDNGIKIVHKTTKKFVNKDVVNEHNTFYYFSNKNITGVDAKDIMSPRARGLVTVANNTCLRDFSQGIFRMRNILNAQTIGARTGQTIDIIFNNKFEQIMKQIGGACHNFKDITADIRTTLFNKLKIEQNKIETMKKKVLLKQNIIALCKKNTTENSIILYIDPSSPAFITKMIEYQVKMGDYKVDIDSINIIDIINKQDSTRIPLIIEMMKAYFAIPTYDLLSVKQNQALLQNKTNTLSMKLVTNKSTEIDLSKQINFPYDPNIMKQEGKIYYNFEYQMRNNNQILCIFDLVKNLNVVILYNERLNNLVLLDITQLNYFFMYNNHDIFNGYTLISLFDSSQYGKILDNDILKIIVIISKQLIRNFILKIPSIQDVLDVFDESKLIKLSNMTYDENNFLIHRTDDILLYKDSLDLRFIKISEIIHSKNPLIKPSAAKPPSKPIKRFFKKYMKYKNKYLSLQSKLSI
jgi:hypothetical protein